MDNLVAKFICDSIKTFKEGGEVVLKPVTTGSDENKTFFSYTPSGEVSLKVVKKETLDFFVPGKAYYLNFTAEV